MSQPTDASDAERSARRVSDQELAHEAKSAEHWGVAGRTLTREQRLALDLRDARTELAQEEREHTESARTVIALNARVAMLLTVQQAAYRLAAICEDVHSLRMGGADPEGQQAAELRSALNAEVIAVARAADSVHAALSGTGTDWLEARLAQERERCAATAPTWGPFAVEVEQRITDVSTPESRAYELGVQDHRRAIRALGSADAPGGESAKEA